MDEDGINPECAVIDHDQETTYEDEDVWQGLCLRCGAELYVDKREEN